jgi:two-component system chemotaxis response regulator CheB
MTGDAPVRIAICDDSRTYALALKHFLEHDRDLRVVAAYRSAEELLGGVSASRPDLITMDLELPGLDGSEATARIMRSTQPVPIVVLSAHGGRGSERAAEALANGALEAIAKGDLKLVEAGSAEAVAVRARLKRLARARVIPLPERPRTPRPVTSRVRGGPVAAVGIAASTGGPQALRIVLSALPATLALPVLVVQHMAPGFTEGLVKWMNVHTAVPVGLAREGAHAGAGVWFAPDGAHLLLDERCHFRLDRRTGGRHVPSGDVLLTSLAAALGARAASVVLTGLGRDGAAGTAAIVAAGGVALAQDGESATVNGMPAAAAAAGAAVVDLHEIAGTLAALRTAPR